MNLGRWYGSATALPDGRLLATSGDDASTNKVTIPEIYDPVADSWTSLPGGLDGSSYAFPITTGTNSGLVYGVAAMRHKTHTPGAGYTEQIEFAQGSGGSATSVALMEKTVPSPQTVIVEGMFSGAVDWAAIGLVIK